MNVPALVLSGGGARAAYQAGVLLCIAKRRPDFHFPILTGVSAGAINAAFIAGHQADALGAARDLHHAWLDLARKELFHSDALSFASAAIKYVFSFGTRKQEAMTRFRSTLDVTPLRDYLQERIDWTGIEINLDRGRLRALALTAMEYRTGKSVTFVHAREDVPLWQRATRFAVRAKITIDHIMASAALPLVFPAACIDGKWYGDGAMRHATPLSPAARLGADRIVAIAGEPKAEDPVPRSQGYPSPAEIYSHLVDSVFLDGLEADAERLERINRLLDLLPPEQLPVWGLRPIELMILRPSEDLGQLAAPHVDRIPRSLRLLLRGLGGYRSLSANLLSYLMFEEEYIRRLVDLGYRDTEAQWEKLERFLQLDKNT